MHIISVNFAEVTSIRSGLRKRKRPESPQSTEPQVTVEWVDEDKLDLWEIKQYGDRYTCWKQSFDIACERLLIRNACCFSVVNSREIVFPNILFHLLRYILMFYTIG